VDTEDKTEPGVTNPWLEDVRGTQVLPIINLDDDTIRVVAGPGTGKTFGLVRRVQRILHPQGLNLSGSRVLVVAFNRVIAKQLKKDIAARLAESPHEGEPVIQTVHALCLKVIGAHLRILLPHEREAMIYDVLAQHSALRSAYGTHKRTEQALRDHEAKSSEDMRLWQAVQQWLTRHHAQLISDLPSLLLDSLQGGDFGDNSYDHVIVDEFQDLTAAEQTLVLRLRAEGGKFMALGDPRQSIYRFRGNDIGGLSKIESLLGPSGGDVRDVTMTECQRCPNEIVKAANQLMGLSSVQPMIPGSDLTGNFHVVVWKSWESEAIGMAEKIVQNIRAHPLDKDHLVMVSRRQLGYRLREEISKLDRNLTVDLSFSESLLESWAVREAFLYFCLLVDPDAPTWRAWLGYQNSPDGKDFCAPERNANAYLKFLTACNDAIDETAVQHLVTSSNTAPGTGGRALWDRAKRFVDLRGRLRWERDDPLLLLTEVFDADSWGAGQSPHPDSAWLDMDLLLTKAREIWQELPGDDGVSSAQGQLRQVARRLRFHVATLEPFSPNESSDLKVVTLWGAKGLTANNVYVMGLCKEAIPGTRRPEYPGTDLEYREEQKRLFYVSITRSRKTLVLSRAGSISRSEARRLGLAVDDANKYYPDLFMSPFLRDIRGSLPACVLGEIWQGCS
jgi:DNA helicase-2/ATP-dependent DNA helicase PcrA